MRRIKFRLEKQKLGGILGLSITQIDLYDSVTELFGKITDAYGQ